MNKVTNIFSKCKRDVANGSIQVRDRKDAEIVYTYCIRYNLGSEDDTITIGTNTFSYEEAIYAATQLIEMDYAKGMIKLKDSTVLDIELIEVHINYDEGGHT